MFLSSPFSHTRQTQWLLSINTELSLHPWSSRKLLCATAPPAGGLRWLACGAIQWSLSYAYCMMDKASLSLSLALLALWDNPSLTDTALTVLSGLSCPFCLLCFSSFLLQQLLICSDLALLSLTLGFVDVFSFVFSTLSYITHCPISSPSSLIFGCPSVHCALIQPQYGWVCHSSASPGCTQ